ncbi:MAG: biopolymer transporter ExbD [Polyangiaceae bacterium]
MASANSDDEEMITGINVTPLVDVVLVLLVILMVTATYLVARTIPVDLPKAATGEASVSPLAITLDARGKIYLDGAAVDRDELRRRIQRRRQEAPDTRAVIAADGNLAHRVVVSLVDLLRVEGITQFAINVDPSDGSDAH